jgi:hypothetical protein
MEAEDFCEILGIYKKQSDVVTLKGRTHKGCLFTLGIYYVHLYFVYILLITSH